MIVTYKDRLSRVGFDLFYHLFNKYHCKIILMREVGSEKIDSEEIFEEIVRLLHCFNMKLYPERKTAQIKDVFLTREEGEPHQKRKEGR